MNRIRTAAAALMALTFLAACDRPPVNREPAAPLATVASVDLQRYLGTWYEIARYDHSFERGCTGVTATYSLNADGTIKVVNRCRKGSLAGPEDVAEGAARVIDAATRAKLGVTFFWPFEGDYWILDLGPSYEWALVGEPSGRYLWILSRTPKIGDDLRASLVSKLKSIGYNTDALIWTEQR
jgi:apolipoprotein D and lipocalin family protein